MKLDFSERPLKIVISFFWRSVYNETSMHVCKSVCFKVDPVNKWLQIQIGSFIFERDFTSIDQLVCLETVMAVWSFNKVLSIFQKTFFDSKNVWLSLFTNYIRLVALAHPVVKVI